ncbi:SGNH/GDSL hydrolase family protein [Metabacillus indicus]|uniref:SGNH/GDSL hydrolase family protein n=1 Tax=Metabacillus indicus TaxID=246786 RepID=UPI000690E7B3|nr:SGNH/GDSL hydrolase family protein [Metabacillus indicus]
MSKVITACVVVLSVCVLVLGNYHWKGKISLASQPEAKTETASASAEEQQPEWVKKAGNLPAPIKEKMKTAQADEKPIKIAAVGSESTSPGDEGWPMLVQKELDKAYGEKVFSVQVLSYPDGTSQTFLNENHIEKVNEVQPDIILLEPFSLNDNGNVGLSNTLKNVESILKELKEGNTDAIIYVQPSHPIYNAIYYPKEVDALKSLATELGMTYLNHWENWPDGKDDKIKSMLTEDQQTPNKEGNKVWADYIVSYFIKTEK